MKLFVKLMLLVVAIAVAGPFFLKGPDGRPMWTIQDSLANVKRLIHRVASQSPLTSVKEAVSDEVEIYRWRDADGVWHFAAEPPQGQPSEILTIDTQTNSIAINVSEPVATPEEGSDNPGASDRATPPLVGPYPSPEAVRALLDDVEALQQRAEERLTEVEGAR